MKVLGSIFFADNHLIYNILIYREKQEQFKAHHVSLI